MAGLLEAEGIFYPVTVHLALLLFLFLMVTIRRTGAVREQALRYNDFAHKNREPEHSRRWVNNLNNQFELPMLFYPLVAMLYITDKTNWVYILLAWLFVAGRLIHTCVQVISDNVKLRGQVFVINFVALALMWLYFLLTVLIIS